MEGVNLNVSDVKGIIGLLRDELNSKENAKSQRLPTDTSVDALLLSFSVISQATNKCQWPIEAVDIFGKPAHFSMLVGYHISLIYDCWTELLLAETATVYIKTFHSLDGAKFSVLNKLGYLLSLYNESRELRRKLENL
jgi:hypothetical protein